MLAFILLAVLIVVFAAQTAIPGLTELFFLNPASFNPFMYVTSIFLHGDLVHLFYNGLALLLFGPLLEQRIGSKRFLTVFLVTGIAGSLLYHGMILAGLSPPIPALGASGAIYGILGALAILAPEITVFVGFLPLSIRQAAVVWFLLEFFGSFNPNSGIASAAHLGGLVVGFFFGRLYTKNANL